MLQGLVSHKSDITYFSEPPREPRATRTCSGPPLGKGEKGTLLETHAAAI